MVHKPEDMFREVKDFLEQELAQQPEDAKAKSAILHFELGQLEEIQELGSDLALAQYELARDKVESYLPSLRALYRHYCMRERWQDAIDILRNEYSIITDDESRSYLLLGIGQIQRFRLNDSASAISSLEESLVQYPKNRPALTLLGDLLQQEQKWPELLQVYQRMYDLAHGESDQARILTRMAHVHECQLQQPEEAYPLYKKALELDPQNQSALLHQERLGLRFEKWDDGFALLSHKSEMEEDPAAKAAWLFMAARTSDALLTDPNQAVLLLEKAHKLTPDDPLPLWVLNQIYSRLGQYEKQASVLMRQLRLVQEAHQVAMLCYQIGQLFQKQLQSPTDAQTYYKKALEKMPWHEPSLAALSGILTEQSNWQELAQLQLLRAEQSQDNLSRADGYVQAARLYEEKLQDVKKAVELYTRAVYLVPGLHQAFVALVRLYRQANDWQALVDLYINQAKTIRDKSWSVGLLRIAAYTADEKLDDASQSLSLLKEIEETNQSDQIETLMHQARICEKLGQYEDLCEIYKKWIQLTSDEATRAQLLMCLGQVYLNRLEEPEQAITAYQKVLEPFPDHRAAISQLAQLYRQTGQHEALLKLLEHEFQIVSDKRQKADLGFHIGELYRIQEKDRAKAIAFYEKVLQVDASHSPTVLALADLYQATKDLAKWIELLSPKKQNSQPNFMAALYCTAAGLLEDEQQDHQKAEQLYLQAIEIAPEYKPALFGLERLYLGCGQQEKLESIQLTLIEQAADAHQTVSSMLRLAATFALDRQNHLRRIKLYDSVLSLSREQPEAIHTKALLLKEEKDWQGYSQALEYVARYSEDPQIAEYALREKAFLDIYQLAKDDQIEKTLERIIKKRPGDRFAISMRELLAHQKNDDEGVLAITLSEIRSEKDSQLLPTICTRMSALLTKLELYEKATEPLRIALQSNPTYLPGVHWARKLHEHLDLWPRLGELLESEAQLVQSQTLANQARIKVGSLYLEKGEVDRAGEIFGKVFAHDPSNQAVYEKLVTILSTQKEFESLANAHHKHLQEVEDEAMRGSILLALSKLYAAQLPDVSKRKKVLSDFLALMPQHRLALEEMVALCKEQQHYRDLEGYLARLAGVVEPHEPQKALQYLLHRSQILWENLGEDEMALGLVESLRSKYGGDLKVLSHYVLLLERQEQWSQVLDVLDEMIESAPPAQKIEQLLHKARLYNHPLQDREACNTARKQAIDLALENDLGLEKIIEHYQVTAQVQLLVDQLGEMLQKGSYNKQVESVMRMTRAQLMAKHLGKAQEAAMESQQAIDLDPNSISARLGLAWLHYHQDRFENSLTEYFQILDTDPFCLQAYQGLEQVFEKQGDSNKVTGAILAQNVLGEDQTIVGMGPNDMSLGNMIDLPSQALGVERFWNLLAHPEEPQAARQLLYEVAPYLADLLPEALTPTGPNASRVAQESLVNQCDTQAALLGVSDFECLIVEDDSIVSCLVQVGDPSCLMLNARFLQEASDAEIQFVTARGLALVLSRSSYLRILDDPSLERLLAGVVSLSERGFGDHLNQQDQVSNLAKRAKKVIPRKTRKALESLAADYAKQGGVDIPNWRQTTQKSAARAALLLSMNLQAAWNVLLKEGAPVASRADLLHTVLQDNLYLLRENLGIQTTRV